jgi:hypothetical protein
MPLISIYFKKPATRESVTRCTDALIKKSIEVFTHPKRPLSPRHFLIKFEEAGAEDFVPNDIQLVYMLHEFEERITVAHENADRITDFMRELLPDLSVGTWILHGYFGKSRDTR